MTPANSKGHWDSIYLKKRVDELSWSQPHAETSLRFIVQYAPDCQSAIVDLGAGCSNLLCDLASLGYRDLLAVDISTEAQRLADAEPCEAPIRYLASDVRELVLPAGAAQVWHDRATFHFFTEAYDRQLYKQRLLHALAESGVAVIATFADDGPQSCSGLPVCRYNETSLAAEFSPELQLVESSRETHTTPAGAQQSFLYVALSRSPKRTIDQSKQ